MFTIQSPSPARIEALIGQWAASGPSFLWAPTSARTLLLDRAKGLRGTKVGPSALGSGGLSSPGSTCIQFATNVGLSSSVRELYGVMLVSVANPAAMSGAFLKVGVDGGFGVGAGNENFDGAGSRLIFLAEAVAWYPGPTSAFARGLNVLVFGNRAYGEGWYVGNLTTGQVLGAGAAINAPEPVLSINGYSTRFSEATVRAVAIWQRSLSGTSFFNELARLGGYAQPFAGRDNGIVAELFRPGTQRLWAPALADGTTAVVLAAAPAVQAASSSTVPVAQTHALSTAAAAQAASASIGAAVQTQTLVSAVTAQQSSTTLGGAVQTHGLGASPCAQSATSSAGALGSTGAVVLGAAPCVQPAASSSGTAQQSHDLLSADCAQHVTLSVRPLAQIHQPMAAACVQAAASSTGAASTAGVIVLGSAACVQPATCSFGAATQSYALVAAPSVQDAAAAASPLVQRQVLAASACMQRAATSGGAAVVGVFPRVSRVVLSMRTRSIKAGLRSRSCVFTLD